MWQQGAAAAYTFFMLQKIHSREQPSVNMKIFIVLKMPNYWPNHARLFPVTWMTRFGTYQNMIFLYVVSDWSHVLRHDNPVSLNSYVDFNLSNSKIKHPQSENNKIQPVGEIISFLWIWEIEWAILKKKEGIWFSLFHKSEFHTAITFTIYNGFRIAIYQNVKFNLSVSFLFFWNKCV